MKLNEISEEMIHKTLDSLISIKIEQHRIIDNPSLTGWDLIVEYPCFTESVTGEVNVTKKTETVLMFSLKLPLDNKEFLYVPEFLKKQMEMFMKERESRIKLV